MASEQHRVCDRLARLGVALSDRALSAEETHAGVRAVVDWFGATIAGSAQAPARILRAALLDDPEDSGPAESGPDPFSAARLVPDGRPAAVRTAALINGTAAHSAELDDIFRDGIYHPGAPTVAAALALAQRRDASGRDLIRAIAVGYEIGDRVAQAVNPRHYAYWHTTGTVGALGAAAAAAGLLGLDEPRFAHALATATTMAAGLQQAFRSDAMSKPLHAGHAAEAGLLAALAAAHGYTGALDVLEGPAGFGAAMAGSPDWSVVLAGPDRPLGITVTTVKNHSCCGHTFAAVDAAMELRARGVRAEEIESVEVRTAVTAARVAGNRHPRTAFEAKFSVSYCVAAALVLGSVRLRAFEAEALRNPLISAVEQRVKVLADADMEMVFPGQRCAMVTVQDRAGRRYQSVRDTRKGDPDDPLTDSELADKYADLSGPVLGPDAAARLAERLWRLDELASVRDLLLAGSGRGFR
jgi:2-methylcitrate dehydratase PrpD